VTESQTYTLTKTHVCLIHASADGDKCLIAVAQSQTSKLCHPCKMAKGNVSLGGLAPF